MWSEATAAMATATVATELEGKQLGLGRADRIEERPRSTSAVVLIDDGSLSEGSDVVGVKMRARALVESFNLERLG
ncbi:hypothetical protein M0R45_031360 [Rubus argutus]|uniref:Uncharacterized protein n=1 Tax=Rubus argutus TaxID=59490 RepID=A0AAW1WFN2_RUBAR